MNPLTSTVTIVATTALLSVAALALSPLSIDGIAGVYREPFSNGDVDGRTYRSENILEIVKLSNDQAYFRVKLYFFNGHQCDLSGIAKVDGQSLLYRGLETTPGNRCILRLQTKNAEIAFEELDSSNPCKVYYCGVRGSFNGSTFPLTKRRTIHYTNRILSSREFKQAVQDNKAETAIYGP